MTGALIGRTPPPATGPHDPAREATGRRVQQGHREGDRDALAILTEGWHPQDLAAIARLPGLHDGLIPPPVPLPEPR